MRGLTEIYVFLFDAAFSEQEALGMFRVSFPGVTLMGVYVGLV